MKKFIKTISVFCLLVFLSLSFVGCGDPKEDKFYEQTNVTFNTFITEVCENADYTNGIKYGEIIESILNKIEKDSEFKKPEYAQKLVMYTQLTDIYDKIFVSSFKFLASFKDVFNVTNPETIKGDTKQKYLNFEQSLADVKVSIQGISADVEELDIRVRGSSLTDAISDISAQALREFKRKYIAVSQELIDVCNEFLNLVENYVYPKYDTYKNGENYLDLSQTQLVNQRTIIVLKSAVNTLVPAIAYLNDFSGDYITLDSDKFFTTLDKYISLNFADETTVTVQELENWKQTFDIYTNDTQNFYVALEKVDLPEFKKEFDCNQDKYLEEYPKNIAYINKILTYTDIDVTNLYTAVLTLCN